MNDATKWFLAEMENDLVMERLLLGVTKEEQKARLMEVTVTIQQKIVDGVDSQLDEEHLADLPKINWDDVVEHIDTIVESIKGEIDGQDS